MAPKRKPTAPVPNGKAAKRTKKAAAEQNFEFREKDWHQALKLHRDVIIWKSNVTRDQAIVRKRLDIHQEGTDARPEEIRALSMLPDCNRIVKPLFYSRCVEEPKRGFVIYPYFPLGDLKQWKRREFDKLQWKPVHESYIWRFFIQMSQALAFIHNDLEPRRENGEVLIHRDIKPENILVVSNGTTYPSFKLHDFGLFTQYSKEKARLPSHSGTFEWQPPENPMINTKAADVWALGACVHYLATGKSPIEDLRQTKLDYHAKFGCDPPSVTKYSSVERWAAARARRTPLRINMSKEEQLLTRVLSSKEAEPQFRHEYSNELAKWMNACLEPDPNRRVTAKKLVAHMIQEAEPILYQYGKKAALFDLEVQVGTHGGC